MSHQRSGGLMQPLRHGAPLLCGGRGTSSSSARHGLLHSCLPHRRRLIARMALPTLLSTKYYPFLMIPAWFTSISCSQPLTVANLERGFNKIYGAAFAGSLRSMYRPHHALFNAEVACYDKRELDYTCLCLFVCVCACMRACLCEGLCVCACVLGHTSHMPLQVDSATSCRRTPSFQALKLWPSFLSRAPAH